MLISGNSVSWVIAVENSRVVRSSVLPILQKTAIIQYTVEMVYVAIHQNTIMMENLLLLVGRGHYVAI